jgi:hypothetical protein
MLFSPVFAEVHPRRMAACAASGFSSNSFVFYPFRTLASHLKATVSVNSFEIKCFRTLCKIPGIGYPLSLTQSLLRAGPRSSLFPAIHPVSVQPLTKCSSSNPFVLITIHFHGGCTPLVHPERFRRSARLESHRSGSRLFSHVPLRPRRHGARMLWNVVVTPHWETSPLVPVSKSMSRADAGCGSVILPSPGQVSCRKVRWPGTHPQGCGFQRAGKAGSVRLGQHALLEP